MIEDLLGALSSGRIESVSMDTFADLIESLDVVEKTDTRFRGFIYLLRKEDVWIIAEHPDSSTAVLRRVDSREAGEAFIRKRLEDYDKMWDGCGCKIDYLK